MEDASSPAVIPLSLSAGHEFLEPGFINFFDAA